MTPQERQLVDDLFDRLAKLENAPRDPEAMSAIMQGLRKAPNAVYALVQTALVQDEALKRANDRIQELEAAHGRTDAIRRLPRFDARRGLRAGPAAARLGAARCVPPDMPAAARSGTAARRCSSRNRRDNMARPALRPALWRAAAAVWAAVAVRSSAPPRRPRPAWSVGRCCSAASADMMGGGGHQAFADAGHPATAAKAAALGRPVRRRPGA